METEQFHVSDKNVMQLYKNSSVLKNVHSVFLGKENLLKLSLYWARNNPLGDSTFLCLYAITNDEWEPVWLLMANHLVEVHHVPLMLLW